MKTIYDYLPKYVLPHYTHDPKNNTLQIGIVDTRHNHIMDCELFKITPKPVIPNETIRECARRYFNKLKQFGVI